jgi:hypothetical protein
MGILTLCTVIVVVMRHAKLPVAPGAGGVPCEINTGLTVAHDLQRWHERSKTGDRFLVANAADIDGDN